VSGAAKIDTLVFDVGKVLIDYRFDEMLTEMGYPPPVVQALLDVHIETKPYFIDLDRGTITMEESAAAFARDAAPYGEEAARALKTGYRHIRPIPENIEFLRRAGAAGYRTLVLSNFDRTYWAHTRDTLGLGALFEGGVVSSEVGTVKPEPEIYRILIEDWQVAPKRALFIDDRAENTRVARELGMHTITLREGMDLAAEAAKWGVSV